MDLNFDSQLESVRVEWIYGEQRHSEESEKREKREKREKSENSDRDLNQQSSRSD